MKEEAKDQYNYQFGRGNQIIGYDEMKIQRYLPNC